MMFVFKLILLTFGLKYAESARILCVVPSPSYSHQIVFQPIWRKLAERGHELIVLTTNPMKDPNMVNIKEIDWSASYDFIEKRNVSDLYNGKYGLIQTISKMLELQQELHQFQLEKPEVQALIHNKSEHFDLVIVENINPTMFAFSHRFKCPMIGIISFGLDFNGYQSIGNPFHPVTSPCHFLPFYSNLNFFERVISTIFTTAFKLALKVIFNSVDYTIQMHFGENYPPIEELSKNIDMVFANTNPVFKVPNPMVPALVEFGGGIHIKPPKPLPAGLKRFLDDSENGVIYLSLGSNVKSKTIPKKTKDVILKTFQDLPYDVLWKFEDNSLKNISRNIKILKWVPQNDVLRHPKIKLFITQCGLQSLEETLYSHVPVVGMPFFADQPYNAKMIEDIGIGLSVDYKSLDINTFKNSIETVINNPKYKEKVIELAKLSKDVPMSGLDKVVFWTEYVIRHKGAKNLRSPTVDIPLYQYYLLDVIGFILIVVYVCFYIFSYLLKFMIKNMMKKKEKTE